MAVDFVIQISVLMIVATGLAVVMRTFKQPTLIAYIFTGIALSWFGFLIGKGELLETISELGIVLLLYIAGLNIRIDDFKTIGKQAVVIGVGHDILMVAAGILIGIFMIGLTPMHAVYLAIALTLSSTIVVVKTLTDRKELGTSRGQILMGTMLLQDLMAMVAIAVFTSIATGGQPYQEIVFTLIKGIILYALFTYVGKHIISKIFNKIASQIENVFLFGMTWVFAAVLIAHYIGFSKEIAAFIAGISIAHLPFSFEVSNKTKSLQDFGLLLFFFAVGTSLAADPGILISPVLWGLVVFVIVFTPIVSSLLSRYMKLSLKDVFVVSIMPIQVSEFSMILMAIGVKLGQVNDYLFSLIIGISIVTILISSSFLQHIDKLYEKFKKSIAWLESKETSTLKAKHKMKNHIVIFGFGRLGQNVARYYDKKKKNILVVDTEPESITLAKRLGCKVIYGDIADTDVWEEANIVEADFMISTIEDDIEKDVRLARWLHKHNPNLIAVAETKIGEQVHVLKHSGFDYVLFQDAAEWLVLKKFLDSTPLKKNASL